MSDLAPRVPYGRSLISADALLSNIAREAPRVPWDEFLQLMQWKQGEHVALIGPTGQGKTVLLMNLLPLRKYVAVLATKPYDRSMSHLLAQGYDRYDKWEPVNAQRSPRRVIWPDATSIDAAEHQEKVFKDAMRRMYAERGWTLVIDEGWYLSDVLSAKREMRTIWTQGRSLGLSFVVATQRPAWVPTEMYDQSTHLFFWRENDDRNLARVSGISGRDPRMVRHIISELESHQCLYVNTRTGAMFRTRTPAPNFST